MSLLCDRHSFKCLICINSFGYANQMNKVLVFYTYFTDKINEAQKMVKPRKVQSNFPRTRPLNSWVHMLNCNY